MKRIFATAIIALALAGVSRAAMWERDFTASVPGVTTQTVSYVLRGDLEAVYVDVPSGGTGNVSVASTETTLFSKSSITADAIYYPRAAMHTTAGAAATVDAYGTTYALTTSTNNVITWSEVVTPVATTNSVVTWGSTNSIAATTNSVVTWYESTSRVATTNQVLTHYVTPTASAAAQTVYGKQPMAGAITVTVTGGNAASVTNSWTVRLIYRD